VHKNKTKQNKMTMNVDSSSSSLGGQKQNKRRQQQASAHHRFIYVHRNKTKKR
jgi:hypothetical protein